MHNNYIAGEWVASKEAVENRNPSDISDLIGQYAQATTAQLETAIDAAAAARITARLTIGDWTTLVLRPAKLGRSAGLWHPQETASAT